jgi:P pilus assembly chaperone PapD
MVLKIFAGVLALSLGSAALAQPRARLGFSPERYVVELGEGGSVTESLMVKNLSDEPITVKLSVSNWDFDENNHIRILPPAEDSLDRWIVINPLRVTIPPNTPQTIRWAIMPRTRPLPGEYRAVIFIEEELPERDSAASASVRMNMRMGIPVYAQVGEAVERAVAEAPRVADGGRDIEFSISNGGNRHERLRGHYGVWLASAYPGPEQALDLVASVSDSGAEPEGFSLVKINDVVVLPGGEREISLRPDLPGPGEYVVQMNVRFGNATITDSLVLQVR